MPQDRKQQNLPARSAPASARKKKPQQGKRRATRTAQMNAVARAPRITMRRPRARRSPSAVTAQFGVVRPRKVRRQGGLSAIGAGARRRVQTVRVRSAHFPWAAFATALVCTALIMVMVFNYVRLNELTNRYRVLQNEAVVLANSRKKLTLALEQKNDLLAFEKEATLSGMVKSDRVEKRYISIVNEDKIEVPERDPNPVVEFFDGIRSYVSGIFRNIFK